MRSSPAFTLETLADDRYRRAVHVDGHDLLLELHASGSVAAPRLMLTVHTPDTATPAPPGAAHAALAANAARLLTQTLRLQDDPAPFLATAARDPVLRGLTERFPGVRPLLLVDPFEALCWAIVGQQINTTFARKLKGVLQSLAGRELVVDGQAYPLFPMPAAIAALDPAVLAAQQFSRQKIATLLGVAQAVATGDLDLEGLRGQPYEEAMAALTRFKGVGRWTAEYVLMRALGADDAIPAADVGLRAVIGRAYSLDRHATEAEARQIAEAWAPWRGWAAFHWWFALALEGAPAAARVDA